MEIGFATKAVIFKDSKVLLITKSDEEEINPNTVDIPGGRLEFGEMPEDSLMREVMEETGLKIQIIKPTRCWSFVRHEKNLQLVGVTYCCKFIEGEERLSHEHKNFVWMNPKEIMKGDFPDWLKKEVSAALKGYDNE